MTSLNLTQAEAAERARMLSVQRYDIALDLTHGDKEFGSITTVTFTVKEPGDTFIDLRAAHVREVIPCCPSAATTWATTSSTGSTWASG